jgi:hypothetical protein
MSSLFYDNDDPETSELIRYLISQKYFTKRPSQFHIKIGPVNFYPTTGVVTIDGQGRAASKGQDFLLKLLAEDYPPRLTHAYKGTLPQVPSPRSLVEAPPTNLSIDGVKEESDNDEDAEGEPWL